MKLNTLFAIIGFSILSSLSTAATLTVEFLKDYEVVNKVSQRINDTWQVSSSFTATPYVVNGELLSAKAGTEIKTLVVNNVVSYNISVSEIVNYERIKDSDVPLIQGVVFSGATAIKKTVTVKVLNNLKIDAIRFSVN